MSWSAQTSSCYPVSNHPRMLVEARADQRACPSPALRGEEDLLCTERVLTWLLKRRSWPPEQDAGDEQDQARTSPIPMLVGRAVQYRGRRIAIYPGENAPGATLCGRCMVNVLSPPATWKTVRS
jgi:hypothetical protein